ncbi:hypothetical protein AX777_16155 [Sphingobium yanoikuyae]|uniref:Uncharacterized protein n=1 Tax=Sphingobium yanoikuyae TaxID=13690 RepID=A0A177JQ69_SPHYA|nr:hypothetical protein AX777_16155 [Sphingobium yanoikuyae]
MVAGHMRSGACDRSFDQLTLHQSAKCIGIPWVKQNDPHATGVKRLENRNPEAVFLTDQPHGVG